MKASTAGVGGIQFSSESKPVTTGNRMMQTTEGLKWVKWSTEGKDCVDGAGNGGSDLTARHRPFRVIQI